jgi:glucosamine--fructose-6-phosphate aminotransferase (isomerizing)
MDVLPRWAQQLRDRHPDGEVPTRERPIPPWLEEEVRRTPLWYIIREAPATRDHHPYLLLEEIHRQPDQWEDILASSGADIAGVADWMTSADVRKVIFTGCGSAFFTAIHGAHTFPRIAGIEASAVEAFELAHDFPGVDPARTLVVGHSGTGGSIEAIQAMELAAELGCRTLAISNTAASAIVRASEQSLVYETHQACGPCISVVSTRILLVTLLALALAAGREGSSRGEMLSDSLKTVPDVGRALIDHDEAAIQDLARRFKGMSSFLLVGSGANYFSVREGTLKVEEQAILVAKAYRTGDFHHGALSLVAPERVVIVVEAAGEANPRVIDAVRAAREAGSPTIAVTWSGMSGARQLAEAADHVIELPGRLPEAVVPIPMTLVFQLLGYYLGVERGYNPDTLRTDHLPNARAWLTAFPLGTH